MKYKMIPRYSLDDVEEISLLSVEEWRKAKEIPDVPKYTSWWWLLSPDYTCNVDYNGNVYNYHYPDDTFNGVRPAFRIPNLKSKIWYKIIVVNTLCTVIDDGYALSDSVICKHRFDEITNDYNKSEIKKFINSDEFKKML